MVNVIVTDPMIIINEDPVAIFTIGESATFTGSYIITQEDVDDGGVVNTAIAEGADP